MTFANPGFDTQSVSQLKEELNEMGSVFKIVPDKDNSEEYVNFYFIGAYEGKEVIYDTALYTLRLHHASEVYELAEHEAAKKFPNFKAINYEEDENGNMKPLTAEEEEIGWFITELIMEMEEEETVKVQEFIDLDTHHDFGIGLDVSLNVEEITHEVITNFIQEFNEDTLVLDETLYSFMTEDEEFEDED